VWGAAVYAAALTPSNLERPSGLGRSFLLNFLAQLKKNKKKGGVRINLFNSPFFC
jgi:hypothetical protein